MSVSALYSIRWLAKSTSSSFGLGLGAIPIWIIMTFLFFVPMSLICAEFAALYQEDGGLYIWVKKAYGEKHGFIVSWLYWVQSLFYYTAYLTYISVDLTFFIGKPNLAQNKYCILVISLVIFWLISIISMRSIKFGKFFTNIGVFGSTVPTIFLILFAFAGVILGKHRLASDYSIQNFIPKLNTDSLVAISTIMFGLSGAELTASFVTEIDNPKKNLPKGIIISALITSLLYVLGSFAMTIIINPKDITASRGLFEAIALISKSFGLGDWVLKIVALGIFMASFGAIIVFCSAVIKMLFGSAKKGLFPKKLTEQNKYGVPAYAILFQAIIVTVIMSLSTFLPKVDVIYNILVTMTSLVALFPYVMLVCAYIKLRREQPNLERPYSMAKKNSVCLLVAYITLILILLGIIFSLVPAMDTLKENIYYEIELIGGSALFVWLGFYLWHRYEKKQKNQDQNINQTK